MRDFDVDAVSTALLMLRQLKALNLNVRQALYEAGLLP